MNRYPLLALLAAFVAVALVSGPASAQPSPISSFGNPGNATSPGADLWGKKIDRIQFQGNRKVEDDAIRVNLLSRAGGVLDLAKVREDIRAMWKMGFFQDIKVVAEPTDTGGVIVSFTLAE